MKRIIYILWGVLMPWLLQAGIEQYENTRIGTQFVNAPNNSTINQNPSFSIKPNDFIAGQNWGQGFSVKESKGKVSLYLDFEANSPIFNTAFQAVVPIMVLKTTRTGTTTEYKNLTVDYDPAAGSQYVQMDLHEFPDALQLYVQIATMSGVQSGGATVSVSPSNLTAAVREVLAIKAEIVLERYFDFLPNNPNFQLKCNEIYPTLHTSDALYVDWQPISGAEEYQLEWKFIDDYDGKGGYIADKQLFFSVPFEENASRITTTKTKYLIPLTYEHGYILFRVRGVGIGGQNLDKKIYGSWSNPAPCVSGTPLNITVINVFGFQHKYHHQTPHEKDKINYQVVTTYAEEGKRKDIVSYMDGSMRNRQSVTGLSTERNTLVAESIYDHQGRPAIQVLPAPVNDATLKYYKNFNQNYNGQPYNRLNFDTDRPNCEGFPDPMKHDNSGASYYYSSDYHDDRFAAFNQNPNNKIYPSHLLYIPDAEDYPFVQTEWTPDQTGRVQRQAGAGPNHILASGHETKYFYGTPAQVELDTLFGNEVGIASHYKKTMTQDANGQISVTYQDAKGNTIATALAGNPPDSLDKLVSYNPGIIDFDLLAFNEIDSFNYSLTSHQTLLIDTEGEFKFSYSLTPEKFTMPNCMPTNVCYDCVYDLEILFIDNICGDTLYHYPKKTIGVLFLPSSNAVTIPPQRAGNGFVGSLPFNGRYYDLKNLSIRCGVLPQTVHLPYPPNYPNNQRNYPYLKVGAYTMVKKLTINEDAADAYAEHFVQDPNNVCSNVYQDFLEDEWASADTSGCSIDCEQVELDLNDPNLNLSAADKAALKDVQLNFCDTIDTSCKIAYQAMLADVSPGGQYGAIALDPLKPDDWAVSVYNTVNGVLKSNCGNNWRFPCGIYDDNNDGIQDTIMDTDGQRKPPGQLLSLSTFAQNFKFGWARALVPFHPEFCYYQRCVDSLETSNLYDFELFDATTSEDALTSSTGFFVPSNPAEILLKDPYFKLFQGVNHPAGVGINHRGSVLQKINKYMTIGNIDLNMLEAAILVNVCPQNPTPSCWQTYSWNIDPSMDTKIWNAYRAFYVSLKEECEYKIRSAVAINNVCYNGCIGEDPFNAYVNGFKDPQSTGSIFGGSINTSEYDNRNQPCNWRTASLFKNKQKRFPSIQDFMPFPIDFYNTDPNVLLDQLGTAVGSELADECGPCLLVQQIEGLIGTYYGIPGQYDYVDIVSTFPPSNDADNPGIVDFLNYPNNTGPFDVKISNGILTFTFYNSPNDCKLHVEWLGDLDVLSFCCLRPNSNPVTLFPNNSTGSHLTITAILQDGTTKDLETFMENCPISCPPKEYCQPDTVAAEIFDLFTHLLFQNKLTSPSYAMSPNLIGPNLEVALASNQWRPSYSWNGSVIGGKLVGFLKNRFKQCRIELKFNSISILSLGIQQFISLTPDYNGMDANGETNDFFLEVQLANGNTQTISGTIDCVKVGKCCTQTSVPSSTVITSVPRPIPGVILQVPKKKKRKKRRLEKLDRDGPIGGIEPSPRPIPRPGPGTPIQLPDPTFDPLCHDCWPINLQGGVFDPIIVDPNDCDNPLCHPPDTIIEIDIPNPCVQQIKDLVEYNAQMLYDAYLDSLRAAVKEEYMLHCLTATENFLAETYYSQHHFTLYYYDQSNSLVKTVPPNQDAGISSGQMQTLKNYRQGLTTTKVYPDYRQWESLYQFNSLGQLRRQYIPDHGHFDGFQFVKEPTEFFYDGLGRLIASQNPEQRTNPQNQNQNRYSYTLFDALGRIEQVGEIIGATTLTPTIARSPLLWNLFIFGSTKKEITKTIYDQALTNTAIIDSFPNQSQDNLRGRVSAVHYYPNQNAMQTGNSDHTSAYSYDVSGNVKALIQKNKFLAAKLIEYQYDLVSGNVNEVNYQKGNKDEFNHRYEYDADNRIIEVQTSPDYCIWDSDARYFYYPHGPLARVELGEENVQGLDYYYNIHGWLMGMNSGGLAKDFDPGKDGKNSPTFGHGSFAPDVIGFNLGYYSGDYQPISGATGYQPNLPNASASSDFNKLNRALYNGNIRYMVTAIEPFMGTSGQRSPMGYTYHYDQLNRLTQLDAHSKLQANEWKASSRTDAYFSKFRYDANGNIDTLQRNGAALQLDMDKFQYNYPYGNNQLGHVDDDVTASNYPLIPNDPQSIADIDDQDPLNYQYDRIGNLVKDVDEGLTISKWNARGKVEKIDKDNGDKLIFGYSGDGNRVLKQFNNKKTIYIRDASGNILAIYQQTPFGPQPGNQTRTIWESAILYGSKRLGEYTSGLCLLGCPQK